LRETSSPVVGRAGMGHKDSGESRDYPVAHHSRIVAHAFAWSTPRRNASAGIEVVHDGGVRQLLARSWQIVLDEMETLVRA
jgi:hypothetical protein